MVGSEMPKGWDIQPLKEVVTSTKGKKPKQLSELPFDNSIPYIDIKALEKDLIEQYADVESSKSFSPNDIAVVWDGARCGWVSKSKEGAIGSTICALTPKNNIESNYLYYFLLEKYPIVNSKGRGVGIPHVDPTFFWDMEVPIPSPKEQKQIAEKLDKLFDQIETIKEASNKIPELLKNFRQQVLTYAVTGKLTNSDFAHWEKSTIGAIGKVKGGKRLPKGEELVNYNTGYPYIRARDLKEGTVLKQNIMYLLPETQEKIKNYIVKTNDVYITIVGAKIGDAGIIPESMNNANLTENAAKITDLSEKIMPQYLSLWLQAPLCQSEIQQSIKSAAQGKLALTRINSLSVCFPPIESQKEIIDKVEYLLGELKIIESKFYLLQDILEKLPQALLRKAFKGELL